MIGKAWQELLSWIAQNGQLYWKGMAVGFLLWLVTAGMLAQRWEREQEARRIIGDSPRIKLVLGLSLVFFLAAAFLGLTPLLRVGGFAAAGGAVIFLVLVTLLAILFLIALYWMLRRKRIVFDVFNRTWRIERGFVFALHVEEGSFEDIDHLVLQEVTTWRKLIWRIALVWKVDKVPYVLFEARHKRPGIAEWLLLFPMGLGGLPSKAYQEGWERWVERLQKWEARLDLPVAIEKEPS